MNGDEQVGTRLVGNRGARFERDESIALARIDNFGAQSRLQHLAQTSAHIKDQVLFFQAIGTDGAAIVASMSRIDHDLANLQAQGTNQRAVAASGGLRLASAEVGSFEIPVYRPSHCDSRPGGQNFVSYIPSVPLHDGGGSRGLIVVAGIHHFFHDYCPLTRSSHRDFRIAVNCGGLGQNCRRGF